MTTSPTDTAPPAPDDPAAALDELSDDDTRRVPAPDAERGQAPFPLTRGREKGYETRAVDAFLDRARQAFEGDDAEGELTAENIRHAAFPLARHGYVVAPVDAALTRIEDAFAARERMAAVAATGARSWVGRTREVAQEVLDRLTRPRRRRFDRARGLRYGYRISEVDLVAEKVAKYLETGESVTVEQVRGVAFRMQRRGYRETQVDAVLDAVVEVMLAVE